MVAERTAPIKGRFIELIGHYLPAQKPDVVKVDKDRVLYWISKGAIPTDTVASLLKREGMPNMERYLEPRNKKRKKKGEQEEAAKEAPKESAQPAAAA